jgi:hypothetical protein
MGASGWNYFAPYDEDVDRALQQLRRDVFARGDFLRHYAGFGGLKLPLWMRLLLAAAGLASALKRRRLMKLGDPDLAAEAAGEGGTHSVIDLVGTSRTRAAGYATRAPARVLEEVYGTATPTRDDVERHASELDERLDRGEAYYVCVYRDGRPDELYFEGNSGD